MLGIWNCIVQTDVLNMKFIFRITNDHGYTVNMKMEPMNFNVEFFKVSVDQKKLKAVGRSALLAGKEVTLELGFEAEKCNGSIDFPKLGSIKLAGTVGEGPSLLEGLKQKIKEEKHSEPVQRSAAEIDAAVKEWLDRMTLEEKIGQMSQTVASAFSFGNTVISDTPQKLVEEGKVGSILGAFDMNKVYELQKIAVEKSRLKIPLFFNADVIHGYQTIFPVPLAWSCSWDLEAIKRATAISAKEASASGVTYNHGPMVDITRDPRWGRVVEGAGEDPYLGSQIAKAQVEGFQGEDLSDRDSIIACLKHFIAYGAVEGGRDYNTVDISEQRLRETYLPPFEAGLAAGAGSVMNSFNTYNGIPIAGNKQILNTLLRKELGFEGMVISDYGSISELAVHGVAKDNKQAAKQALDATLDIEMVTQMYAKFLPELVAEGQVSEEHINAAVSRILTYKYKIGIMDDPYRYIRPEEAERLYMSQAHLEESRSLARKSIVLLKNKQVLPLQKTGQKLALIGPFALSKDLLGSWQFSNYGEQTVSLLEGVLSKLAANDSVTVVAGCAVEHKIEGGITEALEAAAYSDVIVLALGEESEHSGEAASKTKISLPEAQLELAQEIVKLGKPTVLVLTNGRPVLLDWFETHMDAIVETWYLGSQAGQAIADVLYGDYTPSGKLTMSFPYNEGQIPIYYNHYNTGRPATERKGKYASKYLDASNEPLYPFGYGLSYTTFKYSEVVLNSEHLHRGGSITASVTVTNTGEYCGEEIVQMYIRDLVGSVVRPVKELKGFKRISLTAGESQQVIFTITEDDLKFNTSDGSFQAESGDFKVWIGTNSRDVQEAAFELLD
ncbi:glycoside hydrolase family 3 N-terminal domain-containing protein [Paenibacillus terrae]|uniref:glycoside hydrolase family 3 N-terminal domain-containing protein n=1 Tax=Paenibacillus terrae TaxID=159743 RepID=UPI0005CC1FE0|nr:glycoside hydrolase family 3 N-terminal domain-containing protein [Paenibacillus terrae]